MVSWDIGKFRSVKDADGAYNVFVAGGASGIGRATAELLADCGAVIAIADRSIEGARSVVRSIELSGGKAVPLAMEITNSASILSALEDAGKYFKGPCHAVVNAVGVVGSSNLAGHLVDLAEFDNVCAINLRGALALSQMVLPAMIARSYGRILHIASVAGKEGNAGMTAYSASKAGMIGLVKSLAKDVATLGITINALAPGVVRTPLVDALPQQTVANMTGKIPMGRCGDPEEAARMIAWIISPACSFTTGFTFDLSGGRATY